MPSHTPSSPFVATHRFASGRARDSVTAVLAVLAICAALFRANPAQAATAAVSTCDEAALRAAVTNAAAGDTITFGCSGTVTLTATGGGPISIGKNLTIDGSGQSVTISGGGSVGVMEVVPGVTVTLIHLTIANGADGNGAFGIFGGILNAGTLNLIETTVSNNHAQGGTGGIRNWGTLNINASTITGNSGIVGGVHQVNGLLSITGSTLSANIGATTAGYLTTGAIVLSNGTATVTGSTFEGNIGDMAGGINISLATTLTVTNSTFSGNAGTMVDDSGGAIRNEFGTLNVANSTIAGNMTSSNWLGGGSGSNTGGILNVSGFGNVTLANTIVAGNLGVHTNCFTNMTDAGGNLSDDASCGFSQGSSQNNVASLNLGTLADNGGPTRTIALGAGSAAIDAGPCSQATDQRGFPRPGTGSALCDSGAFELQGAIVPAPQSITFTSTAPADAAYGGTYEASATGGGSGNPVVLTIDASSSGVCSIAGTTVSFTGVGTCTVNANQAGDADHLDAPQSSQDFPVSQAQQAITFAPLSDRTFGDPDFSVEASASSGLAVTFSSAGGCIVGGATVHLIAAGACTVSAEQAGDANYLAAAEVSQGFTVSQAPQAITFAGLSDRTFGDPDFSVEASASSGLAVTFSAAGGCIVSGTTVHLIEAGACTITADQPGDPNHAPAPSVGQSFAIAAADLVPPVLTASQNPAPNANGWNGTDVTVSWTCTDAESGVDLAASMLGDDLLAASGTADASCTDLAGSTVNASHAVLIDKVAPALAIASPLDFSIQAVGVVLTFSSADASSGVDTTSAVLSGGIVGNHVEVQSGYVITSAGVYTLTVTATDLAGNVETQSRMFTVYDPAAGFVTGGGWITSPAGAYLDAPLLGGKATFAFVSRYMKGANVPTGKTQFKFNAAVLNFESVSYEWLVVAGNKARFKGTGTINGAGDCSFLFTALDGDGNGGPGGDRFRIQIRDRMSGALIYDNQVNAPDDADPATALGGGNIVIHK